MEYRELRYEVDNRPGWVRLPLHVLADAVMVHQ